MEQLTPREKEHLEESFGLYDTIGDGKIDIGLLGEALRGLGLNPTESEIQKITKEIEATAARRISFEEFLPIYQSLSTKKKQADCEDFIECFRVFDKDGAGNITAGELHHVLTTLGDRLTPAEVELITQGLEDKTGQISIEDFVKSVLDG